MTTTLQPVFARLRRVLVASAPGYSVSEDTARRFGLEGPVGPATLQAWGGKVRAQAIPVAWVEVRKAYVSYHLIMIGIVENAKLAASLSAALRTHMHGKSCFNFEVVDDALMPELERVTTESLCGMKKAGYIGDTPVA